MNPAERRALAIEARLREDNRLMVDRRTRTQKILQAVAFSVVAGLTVLGLYAFVWSFAIVATAWGA